MKELLQYKADEKGIELVIDIHNRIPDILVGDPARLNQVLINLAGNANRISLSWIIFSLPVRAKRLMEWRSFK